jgi:hypothetical protein
MTIKYLLDGQTPMDERSGKAMGEYNWSRSGRPARRIVAIFDQVSERFGSGNSKGNRPTGPRGSLSNPGYDERGENSSRSLEESYGQVQDFDDGANVL